VKLKGKRVAVLVAPAYEDLEFWVPLMRMQEEGAEVTVVGLKAGETYVSKSGGLTATAATAEVGADDVGPQDFDAVLIPGGWAPDKLRRYQAVLSLVRGMYEQGKVVGSICHAGWVLASAGIVRGMRVTGSMGIRDDLVNAGATWVDEPAFREGNVVWGRVVADIPAYCRELVATLSSP